MKKIRKNARAVLSIPAILCFVTFITNLVSAFKDGNIDEKVLHQLLMTADGFEVVLISIFILCLKQNK